ncbi:MAG: hypothetical protein WDN45_11565 [Caulobacteraceae bacterium]
MFLFCSGHGRRNRPLHRHCPAPRSRPARAPAGHARRPRRRRRPGRPRGRPPGRGAAVLRRRDLPGLRPRLPRRAPGHPAADPAGRGGADPPGRIRKAVEDAEDLKGETRKARVERIVERLAVQTHPHDEEQVDRIVREAGDRLDDMDLYGDLLQRPLSELVARICKDLDLTPDWTALAQELWAAEEMQSGEVGWPLASTSAASPASGGGGPRSGGEGAPQPLPPKAPSRSTHARRLSLAV